MFVFGHTGLSAGLVHLLDRRADLRRVVLAAILPDLVDKPLALVFPWFFKGWTRNVGHSVTGVLAFAVAALLLARRDGTPRARAVGPIVAYALHLALDRMWEDGHVLLWPLDGFWFTEHPLSLAERWWQKIADPWTIGGEVVGLAILSWLALRGRLWERERRQAFRATGQLAPPSAPPASPAP